MKGVTEKIVRKAGWGAVVQKALILGTSAARNVLKRPVGNVCCSTTGTPDPEDETQQKRRTGRKANAKAGPPSGTGGGAKERLRQMGMGRSRLIKCTFTLIKTLRRKGREPSNLGGGGMVLDKRKRGERCVNRRQNLLG